MSSVVGLVVVVAISIFLLATFLPSLAAGVCQLPDTGPSGCWVFAGFRAGCALDHSDRPVRH